MSDRPDWDTQLEQAKQIWLDEIDGCVGVGETVSYGWVDENVMLALIHAGTLLGWEYIDTVYKFYNGGGAGACVIFKVV